jgi:SAM-dependent methyltransferase
MRPQIDELMAFYASRLGQVARHMISHRIRSRWDNVRGMSVAGVGYATPFLRAFRSEAEWVVALMPRQQGVCTWPRDARNCVAVYDEPNLPLPDMSVDRLLAVHCIEMCGASDELVAEFWRVLRPEGRLLLVVPNRRGPFTYRQTNMLLQSATFVPVDNFPCLFIPPVSWGPVLHSAPAWERAGRRFWPAMSGVLVVEARKDVHAMVPVGQVARVRMRPVPAMGQLAAERSRRGLKSASTGKPPGRRTGSANSAASSSASSCRAHSRRPA